MIPPGGNAGTTGGSNGSGTAGMVPPQTGSNGYPYGMGGGGGYGNGFGMFGGGGGGGGGNPWGGWGNPWSMGNGNPFYYNYGQTPNNFDSNTGESIIYPAMEECHMRKEE